MSWILKELRQLTGPELAEKTQQLTSGTLQSSFSTGNREVGKPYASSKDEAVYCQDQDDSTQLAQVSNLYRGERGLEDGRLSKKRREWVGRVVSNKMNKTVVVEIERSVIHPLYTKGASTGDQIQGAR